MTDMIYSGLAQSQREPVLSKWWRTVDKTSIALVIGLFAIGILLGLAASPPLAEKNGFAPFHYVQRQAVFGGAALGVMLVSSMLPVLLIRRAAVIGFALAFVALALLPILGTDFGKGAVRWYSLGFASLQPSEFLKPLFFVTSAWMMAAACQIEGPPGRLISFGVLSVLVLFLALQPDFGQASLLVFGWAVMYFISGAPIVLLLLVACAVVIVGVFSYHNSEHFARRIDGFLSADIDPRTQIGYATDAIQEGGFFGAGVGEGAVKWNLPDAHTDFIIAVAAEEYGLILVLLIIGLYAAIVLRALLRLTASGDAFIRIAGAGLACSFGVQAIINMGVAVRLLPAKGMTLPFVSYGGSSLIAMGLGVGMLLAFTRKRPRGDMAALMQRGGAA